MHDDVLADAQKRNLDYVCRKLRLRAAARQRGLTLDLLVETKYNERIPLDNAATSWPKPETVYPAVEHFLREVGARLGRGGHRREEEAARFADETRARPQRCG